MHVHTCKTTCPGIKVLLSVAQICQELPDGVALNARDIKTHLGRARINLDDMKATTQILASQAARKSKA